MPKYAYQCPVCATVTHETRRMEARNAPATCSRCGTPASKIFTTSFQLNTRPEHLSDGNKYALGFDETSRLDNMRQDEKAYNTNWHGAETHRATDVKTALDKTPLNALFPHA